MANPVPTQTAVDVLWLDVAERADVIVEMNNAGVWVFGSVDDMDRQMGLGIVVEYETNDASNERSLVEVQSNVRRVGQAF